MAQSTLRDHTIRTESFWWSQPFTLHNHNTMVDNVGNLVATADHQLIPVAERWIPVVIRHPDGTPRGVHYNGRVFWMSTVCQCIDTWLDRGIITLDRHIFIGNILRTICWDNLAWDLTYHWPNVYLPMVNNEVLQAANVCGFLLQFPSDPYVFDLINDSVSLNTFDDISLSDLSQEEWEFTTFNWEEDDDIIEVWTQDPQ